MYIVDSGFSDILVGIFIALTTIPLILFEYPFGKLTSKIGYRKIFFMGYFIIALCALLAFLFNTMYIIIGLMVLASVGASMVESTTESYFFEIVKSKEREKYYGIYNTTIDVYSALASFIGGLILLYLAFKFLFIFFALVMFSVAIISLRIKEIPKTKR